MPSYATPEDGFIDELIGDWMQTAREEIDDIRGWRNAPTERSYHGGWGPFPHHLAPDTAQLVGWITTQHPKLDPTPLSDLCEHILTWHDRHHADELPDNGTLARILERSLTVLVATRAAIHARIVKDKGKPALADPVGQSEPEALKQHRRKTLPPARRIALATYDWAMSAIHGAEHLTITELHEKILGHPSLEAEWIQKLPDNPETFAKYLRDAGIKRYNTKGERMRKISHFPPRNRT